MFGPRDATGYAKTPHDNLGIQYGFNALNAGRITVEQFLKMNELIGGYDINGQWQPGRMIADPGAAEITHASGRVGTWPRPGPSGQSSPTSLQHHRGALRFPQLRHAQPHPAVYGDHANHVIWRHKGNPPDYAARRFDTMNEWLAAVEADTRNVPLRQKIIERKPALAVDAAGASPVGWVTDPTICNTGPTPSSASTVTGSGASALIPDRRRVAGVARHAGSTGEPLTSDIMRCASRQPQRSDYTATFNDAQWARLTAAFPSGVCDYSRPGIGQVEPQPWQTFATARVVRPFGDPPASQPVAYP